MERRDKRRPDEQATVADGTAAVKAPSDFDSSPVADKYPSDSAPTVVDFGADSPTVLDAAPPSAGSNRPLSRSSGTGEQLILQPGVVLGRRYEILQLLGQGGMGAVYRARDREVNRMVALKVIRPELSVNPAILDRFKQELVLSHQVTHRNVVRIYDLGDADGIKFITMEYIEGQDLRSLLLERKALPLEEAVEIMLQVCRALEAAHAVGVIHRDLKPQNIMRDANGRVVVMDFGLARLLDSTDGMTQTGAIVGTMEYMSPEQGLGKPLDARSDLFTVGLIFYELLTGHMPYKADSALASLLKRTQERAAPVSSHDARIPRALSDIVARCMEPKVQDRYQHVGEILTALEAWQGKDAAATLGFSGLQVWGRTVNWPLVGGILAVLVLALVGFLLRGKIASRAPAAPAGPTVSLAIVPFRNASGDQGIDWLGSSIADMLTTDIGQSSSLRTVSSDRLHQILRDLRISPESTLDPDTLRRLAEFSNADQVIWGQYAKFGEQIRIDAALQDLKHDRLVPLKIQVSSEKDIPSGVDRLAESVRQNVGLPTEVVKELQSSSFHPNSNSLPALRAYSEGVALLRNGKLGDAQKQLLQATKADPTFALAFAKLAQTYASLGYDNEADQAARNAVELSQSVPATEKYLIEAIRAQVTNNYPGAIKAYENMAKASPDNPDVEFALARLYEDTGDFAKAEQNYQKVLTANPKDIAAIVAMGRVATKKGDPRASLDALNRALSLSIELDNLDQRGESLHFLGVAYRMLNKPQEALRSFQEALSVRRQVGQKRGIAYTLSQMAIVENLLGQGKQALAHYQEALELRREIGDKRGLGDTLIDLGNFYELRGEHDQALKTYKEVLQIERDLGNESLQAICVNNIGGAYFSKGEYEDALTYFEQALQLREKSKVPQDIVDAVHNLGETFARMGRYGDAITQYMRALDLCRSINDTRGAAIEADSLGNLFRYEGRFGAAISSKQDALKTLRDLKDRTFYMADVLGGYASALTVAGRWDESQAYLEEALNLSRELKNEGLVAQTLAFQGDTFYYRGDMQSARAYYQRALQAARQSKESDKLSVITLDLAKVDIAQGNARAAISALRSVAQKAEEQGIAYMAVESSINMAEAMMRTHDLSSARHQLDRALTRTDKLGLKPLSVQAHYLLATMLRSSGNATEAQVHYRNALQLLDSMRQEAGADKLLQRYDFKTIYDEATRWSQTAQN